MTTFGLLFNLWCTGRCLFCWCAECHRCSQEVADTWAIRYMYGNLERFLFRSFFGGLNQAKSSHESKSYINSFHYILRYRAPEI